MNPNSELADYQYFTVHKPTGKMYDSVYVGDIMTGTVPAFGERRERIPEQIKRAKERIRRRDMAFESSK